jgi:hypothetical protein
MKLLLMKLLLAKLLLAMMMLAELLLTELLLVGLLLMLLVGLLLLLLPLGTSTHVVCQSLLNHQAGGEFTYSCISLAALGLISTAFPARLVHFLFYLFSFPYFLTTFHNICRSIPPYLLYL